MTNEELIKKLINVQIKINKFGEYLDYRWDTGFSRLYLADMR